MAGRTVELDVACIEHVLTAARAIGPDKLLTLNLSPRTLEVRDFDAGWLLQGLYRNGISPGRVIVELTERDETRPPRPAAIKPSDICREYGLRLAADDVGAGNSGLRLLSQVQFDIVKLDLSLVQDGTRRMGARSVLQSLRDLAVDQHAHVVAEGVETAAHLQVLRDLQTGAGQGATCWVGRERRGGHLRGRRSARRGAPRGGPGRHPCRRLRAGRPRRRRHGSRGIIRCGVATLRSPRGGPRPARHRPARRAAGHSRGVIARHGLIPACCTAGARGPAASANPESRPRTLVQRAVQGSQRAPIGDDGSLSARTRPQRAQRRSDLRHHAPGDDPGRDEPLGLARRQFLDAPPIGVTDAVGVRHEHELATEGGAHRRRGIVRVHVADVTLGIEAHRCQHGQPAVRQQ